METKVSLTASHLFFIYPKHWLFTIYSLSATCSGVTESWHFFVPPTPKPVQAQGYILYFVWLDADTRRGSPLSSRLYPLLTGLYRPPAAALQNTVIITLDYVQNTWPSPLYQGTKPKLPSGVQRSLYPGPQPTFLNFTSTLLHTCTFHKWMTLHPCSLIMFPQLRKIFAHFY